MARAIESEYRDPLDEVWSEAGRRIGFRIVRTSDAFAASDGARTIAIATPEHLDADDCLAQMIFHEICHSLVEGPDSFAAPDWGLDSAEPDEDREHACLRVQAHLAARHGLRSVLAPTTEFRSFYDALGSDPLEPRTEPSAALAVIAIRRAGSAPWAPHLEDALAATGCIVRSTAPFADPRSLLGRVEPAPPLHPTKLPGDFVGDRRCGDCGWRDELGMCRQTGIPVVLAWAACDRFEPELDCRSCGACCREAYHSVTIEADDPVVGAHPALIVDRGSYLELRREGDRCAALDGDASEFSCRIYADRPSCCRELERGGEHCLTARRRVGFSL